MADIIIKNLDKEKKDKAIFMLKCRGKDLTKAVREMVDKLSDEFDKKNNS